MKAILTDVTHCVGCNRCVEACALDNHLVERGSEARYSREELSGRRYCTVLHTPEDRFLRRQCLHCLEPACASACLVGALHRLPEGQVVYDSDKCIGCRYCMLACPYQIPKYEWDTTHPYIRKCDLCHDREGGPACVEACPHDALLYGEREDLLREARKRIRSNPGRYLPRIWGEHEGGGTAVLFISDVSLEEYWPTTKLEKRSIPDLTAPYVVSTPFLAVGVAGFLTVTSWIIHRRNRLAAEAAERGDEGGAS